MKYVSIAGLLLLFYILWPWGLEGDQVNSKVVPVEEDSLDAQFERSGKMFTGDGVEKDLVKAVELLRKTAEQGHMKAQYVLGNVYLKGEGVEKSQYTAIDWYEKSAKQGFGPAQSKLGILLLDMKEYGEAKPWLLKAAYNWETDAQFALGMMHLYGKGVQADPVEAYAWFDQADEENELAAKGKKIIYERMTLEQKKAGRERVREISQVFVKDMADKIKQGWKFDDNGNLVKGEEEQASGNKGGSSLAEKETEESTEDKAVREFKYLIQKIVEHQEGIEKEWAKNEIARGAKPGGISFKTKFDIKKRDSIITPYLGIIEMTQTLRGFPGNVACTVQLLYTDGKWTFGQADFVEGLPFGENKWKVEDLARKGLVNNYHTFQLLWPLRWELVEKFEHEKEQASDGDKNGGN